MTAPITGADRVFLRRPKLLGTRGALIRALPRLGDGFYVLYGDSYLPIDYRAVGDHFLRSGQLGLMTVFENQERYDASNVWFENGRIRLYDKKNKVPQMPHRLRPRRLPSRRVRGFPRDAGVDLADVQKSLVARGELAGCEIREALLRDRVSGAPVWLNWIDSSARRIQGKGHDADSQHLCQESARDSFNHSCPIPNNTSRKPPRSSPR